MRDVPQSVAQKCGTMRDIDGCVAKCCTKVWHNQRFWVACYIRSDLSSDVLSEFTLDLERIFFNI